MCFGYAILESEEFFPTAILPSLDEDNGSLSTPTESSKWVIECTTNPRLFSDCRSSKSVSRTAHEGSWTFVPSPQDRD